MDQHFDHAFSVSKGVGPRFAELLEAAGVDVHKEFRRSMYLKTCKKLEEVNNQKNLCNRVPSVSGSRKNGGAGQGATLEYWFTRDWIKTSYKYGQCLCDILSGTGFVDLSHNVL